MTANYYIAALSNFLTTHLDKVLLGLTALSLFTLIVFISVNIKLASISRRYNELMTGMDGKNLEALLINHLSMVRDMRAEVDELKEQVRLLEQESRLAVKKIYYKRFNAFPDVGSDLSFSVALLNEDNTGVLITSIYGRDENRVYLKPVVGGNSSYALTPEEREILNSAKAG
ncbi:DUF4446 family protein [Thermoanaerobacterium sp. DL9XJH110]|uniref:DUF4446 family protein n=1 Tax=Thermoanaerobacterium sp. DL9XJH110 TaxID=3386643 RepID=UPI003BB7FBA0